MRQSGLFGLSDHMKRLSADGDPLEVLARVVMQETPQVAREELGGLVLRLQLRDLPSLMQAAAAGVVLGNLVMAGLVVLAVVETAQIMVLVRLL